MSTHDETNSLERRALGAAIQDLAAAAKAAADGLMPEVFQSRLHAEAWHVVTNDADGLVKEPSIELGLLQRLALRQVNVSLPEVLGWLSAVGGVPELEMARVAPALVDAARRRKLRLKLARAASVAAEPHLNYEDAAAAVAPVLEEVALIEAPNRNDSLADVADQVLADFDSEARGERKQGIVGLGFPSFDRKLGLIDRHELVLIAARPGCGKTSLALQVVVRAAQAGLHVLMFSLEMTKRELIRVVAAQLSGVAAREAAQAPRDLQERFRQAIRQVASLKNLAIVDDTETLDAVLARCRAARVRRAIDLVCIDYMQLLEPHRGLKRDPREQQVASMSRKLKSAAKSLRTPIIALAQLNRASELNHRPPCKADLRESGALEQDADRVLLLHLPAKNRDGLDQSDDDLHVQVELIVDKHRTGPLGRQWLGFDRPAQRFAELTRE